MLFQHILRLYAILPKRQTPGINIRFDPHKSPKNNAERSFGFGFAARVSLRRHVVTPTEVERGEPRMKAVSLIDGALYAVVFVDRGEVHRIVSARVASLKERGEWKP